MPSVGTVAGEQIVATVNGAAIMAQDLEAAIDRLIPRATFHGNVTTEKRNEFRDQALEDLITGELQYQDGKARGLVPDKNAVKAEMEKIRGRYRSDKEYKNALDKSGLSENQMRLRIERQSVILSAFIKTVREPAQMSEAALKDYYDKNTAKFKQPESVRLRIISSKDEKKIQEALSRIEKGGDFGSIAAGMSEDNYRIKGGDIGYVHRGRVLHEIEDAAFKMKSGEVSGLIKSQDLWFIVKVEDKKPAHQKTFDESREQLKKDLETKRAEELLERWIAELRSKAKIEMPQQTGDAPPSSGSRNTPDKIK